MEKKNTTNYDLRFKVSGQTIIIDSEDLEKIKKYKWYLAGPKKYAKYVVAPGIKSTDPSTVRLHRLVMNASKGEIVDHINGNPLDNRKSNLIICSGSSSAHNRRPFKKASKTSKYKGVMAHPKGWMATISYKYSSIHLGLFDSEEKAAAAYNLASTILFGENFYKNPVESNISCSEVKNTNLLYFIKNMEASS